MQNICLKVLILLFKEKSNGNGIFFRTAGILLSSGKADGKENSMYRKPVLTPEARAEAERMIAAGEDPKPYLKEHGSKNPSAHEYMIRKGMEKRRAERCRRCTMKSAASPWQAIRSAASGWKRIYKPLKTGEQER